MYGDQNLFSCMFEWLILYGGRDHSVAFLCFWILNTLLIGKAVQSVRFVCFLVNASNCKAGNVLDISAGNIQKTKYRMCLPSLQRRYGRFGQFLIPQDIRSMKPRMLLLLSLLFIDNIIITMPFYIIYRACSHMNIF